MNRIVAVPIDPSLAGLIGKAGHENSMNFYNRKINNDIIVAVAPSDLEGKFYALPNSLILAEQIVISTATIDSNFGEVLIGASLLDKRIIFTKENDIAKMFSNIQIGDYIFAEREEIITKITEYASKQKDGQARVNIDRSFNVKGVGTVLLGFVTRGKLKKHDVLYSRAGKEVIVRSIQCQDEDVQEAGLNARVGIAAKGIDESDVRKGDLLAPERILIKTKIDVELKQSKIAGEEIKAGNQYGIFSRFDSGSCMVEELSDNIAKLKLDKEFQIESGDTIMLGRTKKPRIFASGIVK